MTREAGDGARSQSTVRARVLTLLALSALSACAPRLGRPPIAPATARGSLTTEDVAPVIRQNLGRFKYCYQHQLETSPYIEGTVRVRFVVTPEGAVSAATIAETTMHSAPVERCLTRVMRTLQFPAPPAHDVVEVT